MKNNFLSYELSLRAKELGFDEPCLGIYCDEELDYESIPHKEIGEVINSQWDDSRFVTAPLYQQIYQWLREKHNIWVLLTFNKVETYRVLSPDYHKTFEGKDKPIEEAFKLIGNET